MIKIAHKKVGGNGTIQEHVAIFFKLRSMLQFLEQHWENIIKTLIRGIKIITVYLTQGSERIKVITLLKH